MCDSIKTENTTTGSDLYLLWHVANRCKSVISIKYMQMRHRKQNCHKYLEWPLSTNDPLTFFPTALAPIEKSFDFYIIFIIVID